MGIVSSQRQPPDPFNWLSAHVAAGISAFYIMFEDSGTLPEAMATYAHALDPSVVFYYETRTVDRSREQNYVDLMGRQAAWVDRMIARARADGVQWLFHIDDDEIAVPSTSGATTTSSWPRVLDKVPAKCASVHLDNVEAFSPPHPSGPFFDDTEVRFLPRACAHLYAAYGNGKSATRTLEGQASHGPHHFRGGKECELKTGVVGHYEGLAMGPNDTPPRGGWTRMPSGSGTTCPKSPSQPPWTASEPWPLGMQLPCGTCGPGTGPWPVTGSRRARRRRCSCPCPTWSASGGWPSLALQGACTKIGSWAVSVMGSSMLEVCFRGGARYLFAAGLVTSGFTTTVVTSRGTLIFSFCTTTAITMPEMIMTTVTTAA